MDITITMPQDQWMELCDICDIFSHDHDSGAAVRLADFIFTKVWEAQHG